MQNNYRVPIPACRWHNNTNIVGICPDCGSYVCPNCALPVPNTSCRICPDCFKAAYSQALADNQHMKSSAIVLTALGILFTVGLNIIAFFITLEKYPTISQDISKGNIISIFHELTGGSAVIAVMYIIGFLYTNFCYIGFFFGIRRVGKWFAGLPTVIIIFSVLFCAIGIGCALQIAWLIGGFVMIGDFRKIHNSNKLVQTMTDTLATYI